MKFCGRGNLTYYLQHKEKYINSQFSASSMASKKKSKKPKSNGVVIPERDRNATITEQAFVGMIVSAIEVFKKESYGALIGEVHRKHYLVTDSYTYQTAKRNYESVSVLRTRQIRVSRSLGLFTNSKVIGDFHSHPSGPHFLSEWDKKDLLKLCQGLTILVSLFESNKERKWELNSDLSISGSVSKKYFVKMSAYEVDRVNQKIYPLKIVCPYLRKFNRNRLYIRSVAELI